MCNSIGSFPTDIHRPYASKFLRDCACIFKGRYLLQPLEVRSHYVIRGPSADRLYHTTETGSSPDPRLRTGACTAPQSDPLKRGRKKQQPSMVLLSPTLSIRANDLLGSLRHVTGCWSALPRCRPPVSWFSVQNIFVQRLDARLPLAEVQRSTILYLTIHPGVCIVRCGPFGTESLLSRSHIPGTLSGDRFTRLILTTVLRCVNAVWLSVRLYRAAVVYGPGLFSRIPKMVRPPR